MESGEKDSSQQLSIRGLLLPRGHVNGEQVRLLRHDNPGNNVTEKPDASAKCSDEPHHTDEGHIKIKIFSEAQAHTGNFASFARANEALAGEDGANASTAIRADVRVILNGLTTVVAVHKGLHTIGYARSRNKVPSEWPS